MAGEDLSVILPRVLIVSRRTVRKNKFVDFVGNSGSLYSLFTLDVDLKKYLHF